MSESLYELREPGEGFFRDRGSKFYAYAYPVLEMDEIDGHMNVLRKQYYDARHHCYAYRLGSKGETAFAADDREPANTAGPPILAAIRSQELTNVLVVVVRYFGGTKLGVRGLIEAYRSAADEALEGLEKELIIAKKVFQFIFTYEQTAEVNRILHKFETEQVAAEYTHLCSLTLAVKEEIFDGIASMLTDAGFSIELKD